MNGNSLNCYRPQYIFIFEDQPIYTIKISEFKIVLKESEIKYLKYKKYITKNLRNTETKNLVHII